MSETLRGFPVGLLTRPFRPNKIGISYSHSSMYRASTSAKANVFGTFLLMVGFKDSGISWERVARISPSE